MRHGMIGRGALERAVAEWLGHDPLLPGDTPERLSYEMATSEWRPVGHVPWETLLPVVRDYVARNFTRCGLPVRSAI